MKRLLAIPPALLLLVACFDLEHTVVVHDGGAIDYTLRLGMASKVANGPAGKPKDQRDAEWKANLPPEVAEVAQAYVEETPETVWLVIDADLPDVAAYGAFRDAFVARWSDKYGAQAAVIFPPTITAIAGQAVIRADVPRAEEAFSLPPEAKDLPTTWKLVVKGDAKVTGSVGGVPTDDGHTLTYTQPLLEVMQEGAFAEARVPIGWGMWPWVGGAVLLAGIGVGAGLAWRRAG